MFRFLAEYRQWKKEHRAEVQEAKLRHEAMKTPLNYNTLQQMFEVFTRNGNQNEVMEIKGNDFTVKVYWDNGEVRRTTRTEQIMKM